MIVHQAEVCVDCRSLHGEGPIWDAAGERLLWVDLKANKCHAWSPVTGEEEVRTFDSAVCALGPRPDGRLLIALAKRIIWYDWETGKEELICEIEPDKPNNRCNDGKFDPSGRFWIGTMPEGGAKPGDGALYRLDENGELTCMIEGLTIPNGIDWTADQSTMFFTDSKAGVIWAYDFDPADSSIANQRVVVTIPSELGVPDGLCLAPDDTIWLAHWGAGCVIRWDPETGQALERVDTGCPYTTSCIIGDEGKLYISTSRGRLDAEGLKAAPHSGSIFVHRPE